MDISKKINTLKQKVIDNVAKNDDIICDLCDEIITLSKLNNDTQSIAFAYIWKADHHFYVHFDLKQLLIELKNAEKYIDSNQKDQLLEKLYSLFALFYENTYDIKSCFQYRIKSLEVAEEANLEDSIGVAYGNIGNIFFEHQCREEALYYTNKALHVIRAMANPKQGIIRLLLNNSIVLYLQAKQLELAKHNIDELASLPLDKKDLKIYVDYVYVLYYATQNDKSKAVTHLHALLENDLMNFPNRSFVFEFLAHTFEAMLEVDAQEEANTILSLFAALLEEEDFLPRLTLCKLKIKFAQKYHLHTELKHYYREYYDLYEGPMEHTNALKLQGLKMKLELAIINVEYDKAKKRVDSLQKLVNFHELTQVYNRRYFNIKRNEVLNNKATESISFVIFDVDYFKEYNDFYGHLAGDDVLREVAKSLKICASENMVVACYGGDEFVVLAWNCTEEALHTYVERVRANLHDKKIDHERSKCSDRVTLSIGYGSMKTSENADAIALFEEVDDALYYAKSSGRNKAKSIQDLKERIVNSDEKI